MTCSDCKRFEDVKEAKLDNGRLIPEVVGHKCSVKNKEVEPWHTADRCINKLDKEAYQFSGSGIHGEDRALRL